MFMDKPLLGIGPKMFRKECNLDKYRVIWGSNYQDIKSKDFLQYTGCSTHPHSTYLQLLSETGIIGFLFVSYLFFYVLYKFYSEIKTSKNILYNSEFYFLLALTITLLPILPSLNFFNNWINIIYYLPVGFYLYVRRTSEIKIN